MSWENIAKEYGWDLTTQEDKLDGPYKAIPGLAREILQLRNEVLGWQKVHADHLDTTRYYVEKIKKLEAHIKALEESDKEGWRGRTRVENLISRLCAELMWIKKWLDPDHPEVKKESNVDVILHIDRLLSDEGWPELNAESEAGRIAHWLESLSRHPGCPDERRYWYQGVAADIRNRVWERLA